MSIFQKRKKSIALESNPFKKVFYMIEDFIDRFSLLPFRYLIVLWFIVIVGGIIVFIFGPK
jgi:hypothetical protein